MPTVETLEAFYQKKLSWVPANLQSELGHFNIFNRETICSSSKPAPYSRRDYYKISLMIGDNRFHYADKSLEIRGSALLFANPQVPYQVESLSEQSGFFCIFTESFMNRSWGTRLTELPVFRPGGHPIFLLDEERTRIVRDVFIRMQDEIASEYVYKYDALRNYVLELIHFAQKAEPVTTHYQHANASVRISTMFVELLERQFPIESPQQQVRLRKASDFAGQLSVHVNHLNRALKEVTGKTTTILIAERLVQEAKALLRHTDWNVSEVAYGLGFEEPAHFNNFFRKHTKMRPTEFRVV